MAKTAKKKPRNPLAETIGHNIAHFRLAREWTQAELAERLGVHRISIASMEGGAYVPATETIFRLADILGIATDALRTQRLEHN